MASEKSGRMSDQIQRYGLGEVVNCDSKFKYTYGGAFNSRRGCRIPLVDDVDVEFSGSKAKLFWAESINGKKIGSETYNITAILH